MFVPTPAGGECASARRRQRRIKLPDSYAMAHTIATKTTMMVDATKQSLVSAAAAPAALAALARTCAPWQWRDCSPRPAPMPTRSRARATYMVQPSGGWQASWRSPSQDSKAQPLHSSPSCSLQVAAGGCSGGGGCGSCDKICDASSAHPCTTSMHLPANLKESQTVKSRDGRAAVRSRPAPSAPMLLPPRCRWASDGHSGSTAASRPAPSSPMPL